MLGLAALVNYLPWLALAGGLYLAWRTRQWPVLAAAWATVLAAARWCEQILGEGRSQ